MLKNAAWRSYLHPVSSLCRRGIWGSSEATCLQPQKSRIQAYPTHGGLLPLVKSLLSGPWTARKPNLETGYAVSVSVICYKAIDLQQTCISHSSDDSKSKMKRRQSWCLVRTLFVVCRCYFSHYIFTWVRERSFFLFLLLRALIAFVRAPPSWPNYLPRAPPPNTITLWVRISIYEFYGNTISS